MSNYLIIHQLGIGSDDVKILNLVCKMDWLVFWAIATVAKKEQMMNPKNRNINVPLDFSKIMLQRNIILKYSWKILLNDNRLNKNLSINGKTYALI